MYTVGRFFIAGGCGGYSEHRCV